MAQAAKDTPAPVPPKTLEPIPPELKVPQAPKRTIYQRINAVMRDVRGVGKHSTNPQGNYRYAGHEAVTEALRDAYVKHGIVRTANVVSTQLLDKGALLLTVRVSWICDDEPTSRLDVEIPGLQSSVKKDGGMAPVQVGMALSYAVKNAEFKCFALTGDDTPDTEDHDTERDDEPPRDRRDDDPNNLAVAYLGRFTECRTEADVKALKEEVRANWQAVRGVPNFGEHMVTAIRKASERIRGAKTREPGED